MNKFICLIASILLIFPVVASAHSDEYLDAHPELSIHGGQTHMAGPYHIEIVTSGTDDITVYMTDHAGNPIDVEVAHGSAIIMNADKTKTTVSLAPAGENFLKGSGKFTLTKTTNVWVSVKFPDEPAWRSKFNPLGVRKIAIEAPVISSQPPAMMNHSSHKHH